MTKEERDEMMHRNWVAQMNGLGFDESGYKLDFQHSIRLVEEPKWISVKDRLPDESGNVLVYCNGYITNVHYSKKHQKFNMYDSFKPEDAEKYTAFDDVTHWMPLPEPPKEGDNK